MKKLLLKLYYRNEHKEKCRSISNSFSPPFLFCTLFSFEELCQVFERIEATTKRLVINEILTEFFVKMMKEHPDELVSCIYLCLCKVKRE